MIVPSGVKLALGLVIMLSFPPGNCIELNHTAECDPTVDQCISPLTCIEDATQLHRCLCSPRTSSFWTDGVGCRRTSSFVRITSSSIIDKTTTSITVNWSVSEPILPGMEYLAYAVSQSESKSTDHPTSHTFTSLRTGRYYHMRVVISLSDDYPNYPVRTVYTHGKTAYTLPAQPGPVDESQSSLSTPPYSVNFSPSEGDVQWYSFTITPPAADGQSTYTLGGKITRLDLNLTENTVYQYRIIAYNSNSDASEPRIGTFSTNPEDDTNIGIIVGAVVGCIALIAVVVILVVVLIRRRRGRPKSYKTAKDPKTVELLTTKSTVNRSVKIREFKQRVRRFHEDQNLLFEKEFADLKNESLNFNHPSNNATPNEKAIKDMPSNKARDRMEVKTASDETMLLLKANFIMGINSVQDYIATQDPPPKKLPDFWRMIWDQKCKVIVMLSDLTETGKQQVPLYWPKTPNKPIAYKDVIVTMTHFVNKKKYVIRHFKISMNNETRQVTHFCLSGWLDFSGKLTIDDVIEFARLVREKATSVNHEPVVVHCSAGAGPTGTFIALDHFLQYVDKKGLDAEIDIYSFVLEMKRNRPRMVQAEAQYILIFDALAKVIEEKLEMLDEAYEIISFAGNKQRDEDEQPDYVNEIDEP